MPVTNVCAECGKQFQVKPRAATQKCCSRECQRVYETKHGRISAQKELMHYSCTACGADFAHKPSIIAAYRKKHGKDPLYCSMKCAGAGMRKKTAATSTFVCEQCGKIAPMSHYEWPGTDKTPGKTRYYREQRFCNTKCKADHQKQVALDRFERGEYSRFVKSRNDYVYVSIPSLVTGKKHSVLEHRFVMSRYLGRDLTPEETVHHRDGCKSHNDLSNLELFTSRHGPGQRVVDQVSFAIDMLNLYPEFLRAAGYQLVKLE